MHTTIPHYQPAFKGGTKYRRQKLSVGTAAVIAQGKQTFADGPDSAIISLLYFTC